MLILLHRDRSHVVVDSFVSGSTLWTPVTSTLSVLGVPSLELDPQVLFLPPTLRSVKTRPCYDRERHGWTLRTRQRGWDGRQVPSDQTCRIKVLTSNVTPLLLRLGTVLEPTSGVVQSHSRTTGVTTPVPAAPVSPYRARSMVLTRRNERPFNVH